MNSDTPPPPFDVASVDGALGTTRAVRLRLDLDRPVDDEIILDCIEVAEQAPTGGNMGSRRWVVVRDPAKKAALAELYVEAAGHWMIESRDRLAGTGHPGEPMMRSAAHLAEHLAEVPAIVIPCIIGRHDGSGRPGLFDSILQSAWSFCVALRARGLGTAWTTAILQREDDLRAVLGIPDDLTPVALLPVAWTKGTDFRRAPRHPARDITFFDRWAVTYERGPHGSPRFSDGPGTVVEIDIAAPPKAVWPLVTDIELPAQDSDEFLGAVWDPETPGPALGARFTGTNHNEMMGTWDVPCFVDVHEERRRFGWCTGDVDDPGARWRFELEPIGGGTRLRYRVHLGPGTSGLTQLISQDPDNEARFILGRLKSLRSNMNAVVSTIRERAEAAG